MVGLRHQCLPIQCSFVRKILINMSKYLFFVSLIILGGLQVIGQLDVLALVLGLPGSHKVTATDQYIIS